MTGDVVTVPGPCLACGSKGRRLTTARDLVCATCHPAPDPPPPTARTRTVLPTITTSDRR